VRASRTREPDQHLELVVIAFLGNGRGLHPATTSTSSSWSLVDVHLAQDEGAVVASALQHLGDEALDPAAMAGAGEGKM
jgi:hypothetical protein